MFVAGLLLLLLFCLLVDILKEKRFLSTGFCPPFVHNLIHSRLMSFNGNPNYKITTETDIASRLSSLLSLTSRLSSLFLKYLSPLISPLSHLSTDGRNGWSDLTSRLSSLLSLSSRLSDRIGSDRIERIIWIGRDGNEIVIVVFLYLPSLIYFSFAMSILIEIIDSISFFIHDRNGTFNHGARSNRSCFCWRARQNSNLVSYFCWICCFCCMQ